MTDAASAAEDRYGHVFVVPGSLDLLDCDDVIVPTDHRVSVTRLWTDVLGWRDADAKRAEELAGVGVLSDERPFAQLPADGSGRRRWLLSVGDSRGDVGVLITALDACLAAIAHGEIAQGRVVQRVVLPTVGVSRGGFGSQRGAVIRALLLAAGEAARRYRLDIVFAAFNPADYSAFQSVRRTMRPALVNDAHEQVARDVADLAASGRLALFMGAGTGMSAGLPSWDGLLTLLAARLDVVYDEASWKTLGPLDAAELLRRAARDRFPGEQNALGRLVGEIIRPERRYALSHVQLASLGCEQVITTNFDQLFEAAAAAIGRERPVVVLPQSEGRELARSGSGGWLLKLHGDVAKSESIILDRRSFVTYGARQRPLGGVLQTTLLTKHLLVIGASMTDDNVIRLVHEVAELSEQAGASPRLGTVLTLGRDDLRARLWSPEFEYVDLSEGAGLTSAARKLEVFLDRVAMLTTRSARHLLSGPYESLLADAELDGASGADGAAAQDLARELRALTHRVAARPEPDWQLLAAALAEFGAEDGRADSSPRSSPHAS